MQISRRKFVGLAATSSLIPLALSNGLSKNISVKVNQASENSFEPWIEIDAAALRYNAKKIAALSGNRQILAVIKNNAYGLGTVEIAKILNDFPEIMGFAVVKTEACIKIREAGITKPVLLMALANDKDEYDLVSQDIQLSIYTDDAQKRMEKLASKLQKPINVHLYLDTGMSRMGMPYHRAYPWIQTLAASKSVDIVGTFMGFTEEPDFDKEQLKRFTDLAEKAAKDGISLGKLHAASSNAVYHFPESHLDFVRPGIALYGAYPSYAEEESKKGQLKPAYSLKTRVVRVEKLRVGDSVSYGRNYIAKKPTWVATLPIGHSDGYPRESVAGAKVLIGNEVFPVIGAVSASHAILEIGDEKKVEIGDIAQLVGPDHPEVHPNAVAQAAGVSVYDILMHMNKEFPKVLV